MTPALGLARTSVPRLALQIAAHFHFVASRNNVRFGSEADVNEPVEIVCLVPKADLALTPICGLPRSSEQKSERISALTMAVS